MPARTPLTGLEGFSQLSESVFLYSPPSSSSSSSSSRHVGHSTGSSLESSNVAIINKNNNHDSQSPGLIVLLTWMSASPRHITKYTSGYARLFPTAQIMVITVSMADIVWRRNSVQESRLASAVNVTHTYLQSPEPRILLHLFSNGGAQQTCRLAAVFRRSEGIPLPLNMMVLDSAPGRATYRRSAHAMILSLPKSPMLRVLGILLVHLVLIVIWIINGVFGVENVIDRLRRELNTQGSFSTKTPRCYLYSKMDQTVWWEDVEDHANEAVQKGWHVAKVLFQKSTHVAHLMEDEQKYWGAIMQLKKSASQLL